MKSRNSREATGWRRRFIKNRISKINFLLGLTLVGIAVFLYQFLEVSEALVDFYSPKIIGAGDSIMSAGVSLNDVAEQLSVSTSSQWQVKNVAIGGGIVGRDIVAGTIPRPSALKFPGRHKDIVWVLAGTNNIGYYSGREKVEELLASTETLFRELHAAGYTKNQCFFTDILPRNGGSEFEEDRVAFNAQIARRLESLAHVIHSGSNPALQNPLDKEVFLDGVHPTPFGHRYLAADAFNAMRNVLR